MTPMVHTFFEKRVELLKTVLGRFAAAMEHAGIPYAVVGGVDVLLDTVDPRVSKAIHPVFSQEKEPERMESAWVAPVEHLLQMKLTSFRLKDRVHIQDMDAAGLITPEIEGSLTAEMRARLDDVRTTA